MVGRDLINLAVNFVSSFEKWTNSKFELFCDRFVIDVVHVMQILLGPTRRRRMGFVLKCVIVIIDFIHISILLYLPEIMAEITTATYLNK